MVVEVLLVLGAAGDVEVGCWLLVGQVLALGLVGVGGGDEERVHAVAGWVVHRVDGLAGYGRVGAAGGERGRDVRGELRGEDGRRRGR